MMPLTDQEKKDLPWSPGERYALVNMKTKSIFLGSDELETCLSALNRMTFAHPKYHELEVVINPHEKKAKEAVQV